MVPTRLGSLPALPFKFRPTDETFWVERAPLVTVGSFHIGYSLEMAMHAAWVDARKITDHPESPAWISPNPSARKFLCLSSQLAGRLQVGQNSQKDVVPKPLFRTHRHPKHL